MLTANNVFSVPFLSILYQVSAFIHKENLNHFLFKSHSPNRTPANFPTFLSLYLYFYANLFNWFCFCNLKTDETKQVQVCKICYSSIHYSISAEKRLIQQKKSEKEPLVISGTLLGKLRITISENMSELKQVLQVVGEEHTEKNHELVQKGLVCDIKIQNSFEKIEKVVKQLDVLKCETAKQLTLKKNIKQSFVIFIQDHLPSYRLYHRVKLKNQIF